MMTSQGVVEMTLPPYDHWITRFLKQQRELEKIINPFPDIVNRLGYLPDHLKHSQIPTITDYFRSSHIESILSVAGISENYLNLQKEIENKLGSITSFSSQLQNLSHLDTFESIISSQENIYRIQDKFAKYTDLIELPSDRIASVLAAAEASSRLWKPDSFFHEFTLSSVAEYQYFIDRQFSRMQYDNDETAQRRVEVSDLSGDLLESISASAEIGGALEKNPTIAVGRKKHCKPSKASIYGHVNQHIGFVYNGEFSGDTEEVFHNSLPPRIVYLGCSITEQIYKINCFTENSGQEPIFKPTPQTMRACALIPSRIATNELEFNLIVDHLYFLLYEGSGAADRLTTIIKDSLLQPLWKVKHLRLAARHDIDHGSKSAIQAKRKKISETYISLINQPFPMRPRDWQTAQFRIYAEIDIMLQEVGLSIIDKRSQ